jgi:plastocyanin domain-containing protein
MKNAAHLLALYKLQPGKTTIRSMKPEDIRINVKMGYQPARIEFYKWRE